MVARGFIAHLLMNSVLGCDGKSVNVGCTYTEPSSSFHHLEEAPGEPEVKHELISWREKRRS